MKCDSESPQGTRQKNDNTYTKKMGSEEKAIVRSKECYLSAFASDGIPTSDHLRFRTVDLPVSVTSIPDGHIAVEILSISVDPYLRTRMLGREDGLYFSQFKLDEVVLSCGVGKVIASKDDRYATGDITMSLVFPVAEYAVVPSELIMRKIDPASGIPLQEYVSSIGVPGFAAWVVVELLGLDLKQGSNVFISAAAGGVGMYAGQLFKLKGCRVIGSTGSDEKVKLVKDEFGYDDAFNYKVETDLDAALSRYFPDGIDFYLDNVGGKTLEAVLNHVNTRAHIVLCGMVSQYNQVWTERDGVRNLLNMVGKEVKMEGFMMGTYFDRFEDFVKDMEHYLREGKIKSKHRINQGIEAFVDSLGSIFSSSNIGKLIIQVNP
ncbi:(+)-pulegone reductase-like [Punica granatum]|uniref:(+)-pulegone reductase-like n=1 Tax=Punica granatum TaxID=22663 RepID=A0A6P8C522_PUNGR|nr:(+)-pulegone reductase-like [Punica granatum]